MQKKLIQHNINRELFYKIEKTIKKTSMTLNECINKLKDGINIFEINKKKIANLK